MTDLVGQSLGRYHILEQLGEGGMATVYKAYDTRLERDVAVKVIRTDLFGKAVIERILKRFEREAKSLAKLSHPNIVGVIDYGENDGAPYLVLVYLPGGTLKERMKGKPMPWQEAVRLLIPIANALDYAHEQKIIHRDVKPANILLTVKGQPMLSDFGIAKILEMEDGHTLTGTGMGVGTPEYMAPEQGMGRDVDGRADIYSLGIIFYELITGRKPYTADTPMAVILKHMTDPLPRPHQYATNLPDAVERVLLKALAKDPKDRYADAGAFAIAMENLTRNSQPHEIANEQHAREMDDTSETMDTFATNLQTVPETKTRQKAQRTPAPVSVKLVPSIRKRMMLGLGTLGLIVVSLWIGSLLRTSMVSPVITESFVVTKLPATTEAPITTEVPAEPTEDLLAMYAPDAVKGDIVTAGSSTVFFVSEQMAILFQQQGFMGYITVDSIGDDAGFERFCVTGETDISNASRIIKDSEVKNCKAIGRNPLKFRIGTDSFADPLFIYSTAEIMQEKPQVAAFIYFYLSNVNDNILDVGYFPAPAADIQDAMDYWMSAISK